jgi:thiamine pyrophosphate-dependent acetolactate synthase large subunit-like protein
MCLSVPDPHAMVLVGTAFQSIGLGFGFGSAAGVSAARPERTTVLVSGDGAELHQYAAKGLHSQAMLIDQVDFATVGRALGAEGSKARTLSDLRKLEEWLAGTTTACSFWTWPSRRRSLPNT